MKIQLVFFLIVIACFQAESAIVVDLDSLLTDQELQELKVQCENIQQTHKINFFVYLYSNEEDKPELLKVPRGPNRFIQVFINRTDTSLSIHTVNLDATNKRFFQNVFFQFLKVPMNEGSPIMLGLKNTLNEIDQELERQRVKRENKKLEDLSEKEFDPRGVQIIKYLIGILLAFMILLIIKGAKTHNKFEALEYYGLSRLPTWLIIPLGIFAFLYGSFLILQHIGNGAWVVVMCYIFAFYPIMVILGGVIKGVLDSFELKNHSIEKPLLTLGQQLWLIRPKSSTEHLMEVIFYELIIKQIIHLEIETYEKHRRIITEYFISPDSAFDPNATYSTDEKVLIKELLQEPEGLQPFLHRVYKSFGRFKAYRKDHVLKALYRTGLLNKNGWPINHFGLTAKGLELRDEIKNKEQEQATIITLGIKDPSKIEGLLSQMTPEVLLIEDFEQQLTHFYNAIVEMNLLNQAMALPIGFLFHPDFSLRTFNLKISGAYKYRIPWEEMYESEDW